MIIPWIYRGIVALVLVFTLVNLFEEKDWLKQCTAALVTIPLILRMLMIK